MDISSKHLKHLLKISRALPENKAALICDNFLQVCYNLSQFDRNCLTSGEGLYHPKMILEAIWRYLGTRGKLGILDLEIWIGLGIISFVMGILVVEAMTVCQWVLFEKLWLNSIIPTFMILLIVCHHLISFKKNNYSIIIFIH